MKQGLCTFEPLSHVSKMFKSVVFTVFNMHQWIKQLLESQTIKKTELNDQASYQKGSLKRLKLS